MTHAFACTTDHCITCSDEAVAMRVASVGADGLAACDDEAGVRHEVEVALVPPVAPGDVVLVHAGVAIQATSPDIAGSGDGRRPR